MPIHYTSTGSANTKSPNGKDKKGDLVTRLSTQQPKVQVKPKGHNSTGGRNFAGHITCYHRGGGHKRRSRWVNFVYSEDQDRKIVTLVYDPRRRGQIAQTVATTSHTLPQKGDRYELIAKEANSPRGVELRSLAAHTTIFNLERVAGEGGQLIRSAGCFGTIVNHVGEYTRVRLPSGEQRLFPSTCKCSVGIVGGTSQKEKSLVLHRSRHGKAGRSRWLGIRPTVRGTARNPVDHPHGGGQGKTSGGRPSVTPWSVPKGVRTSSKRGVSYVVISRRAEG